MKIIPVLDLMKGLVVHAIKGERNCYQPIQSILSSSADPLEVAHSLQEETKCRELYIADLDAIQGIGHNRNIIAKIATQLDADLWVDAGIADGESGKRLMEAGADVIIIGSETSTGLKQLRLIFDSVSKEKVIFSLDIIRGLVHSCAESLKGMEPLSALERLTREGLDRFILLTLDIVGSGSGPDLTLLRDAKRNFPGHMLIAGGGVKTLDHLHTLSEAGMGGVLIATALHKGWITGRDISSLK